LLQDAVVMGQHLKATIEEASGSGRDGLAGVSNQQLGVAFRTYEAERVRRVFPVQLRSYIFGAFLQIPYWPVRVSIQNPAFSLSPSVSSWAIITWAPAPGRWGPPEALAGGPSPGPELLDVIFLPFFFRDEGFHVERYRSFRVEREAQLSC
jgi:hypothetical protein